MNTSADFTWALLIDKILRKGQRTKPRGLTCIEIMGNQTSIDMNKPIVTTRPKLGYRFLAADAWMILSGRNDVASISPYSKTISNFSDDGFRFSGAYGPKIVDQLTYAVESIVQDQWCRQSVIEIWRPNPRPSKDIPCTLSIQWLLRPHVDGMGIESLRLHCFDTMRSSDAWLGWPYDVFAFSMLSAYVALMLRYKTGKYVTLGDLYLTAGSQHLYEHPELDGNFDIPYKLSDVKAVLPESGFPIAKNYRPLDLDEFTSPDHLIQHLADCKDRKGKLNFMREFQEN